jgi:hypothetical protein
LKVAVLDKPVNDSCGFVGRSIIRNNQLPRPLEYNLPHGLKAAGELLATIATAND